MSKSTLRVLIVAVILLNVTTFVRGTTIRPFADLGELATMADVVVRARASHSYESDLHGTTFFRTQLVVLDNIKGELQSGDAFEVQKWERIIDGNWMTMWGDLDLYDGSIYLLFLEKRESGLYHPICYSYYVFEEMIVADQFFFVPSPQAREFEVTKDQGTEPLGVYYRQELVNELRSVVHKGLSWDRNRCVSTLSHGDFITRQHMRAEPSHCAYLSSNNRYFRWKDFSTNHVALHYEQAGQVGCSSANVWAQQCVLDLNTSYPGINLVVGGTVPALASCVDGSAIGADYRSWISDNLGGSRHIVIQYDDPCNEISDLSNCSGILAIGGLYGLGSHTYNGETWYTGSYGYVVINDGVGDCRCSEMGEILQHEVTHALGLGHILTSFGDANMNPSCCHAITGLDQDCVLYSYGTSSGALPLELLEFEGDAESFVNALSWTTAWESNIDRFVLQRTNSGPEDFQVVAEIASKGDTEYGHEYTYTDTDPDPESIYRLLSVDHSGEVSTSDLVVISRDPLTNPVVYPTMPDDFLHVRLPNANHADFAILAPTGQLQLHGEFDNDYQSIMVAGLPVGWYYLRLTGIDWQKTFKFFRRQEN